MRRIEREQSMKKPYITTRYPILGILISPGALLCTARLIAGNQWWRLRT
jgi:hypothetical protein